MVVKLHTPTLQLVNKYSGNFWSTLKQELLFLV